MEDLKRERTQYRRMFTKACNEFEKVSKDLGLDERVEKLQVIAEKALLILACEESCKKHIFEEADKTKLEKELDEIEVYLYRARILRKKLEKLNLEQVCKSNPVLDESSPVPSPIFSNTHNKVPHLHKT
ncbi:hypothetical protein JTE90_007843 [Oedothorax gibbosus]|uniref:Uncharacterized protein n=1 Tax=Oedothorax gibbosus TaxID=931172 RepID=A0AAV6VH65_9ARAC|nr:hypothetical protein JTE90_007843 [Oedothorax gibbosus]